MKVIEMFIKYSVIVTAIGSIIGIVDIILTLVKLNGKRKKTKDPAIGNLFSRIKKEPVYLVLLVSLISLAAILFLAFKPASQSIHEPNEIVSASPTPSVSFSPSSAPAENTPSEITQKSIWLDELTPILERDENYFFGGWQDTIKFKLDERTYSHGLGMRISGTDYEEPVIVTDCPDGIYRDDCKQVSIDFALRSNFDSLSFSVGADKSDMKYFGARDKNGIARVKMIDLEQNNMLFDTGWVDYSYARYNAEINLLNVEKLRIVFLTCGIPHKSMPFGLQFAIVNPVLTLVGN